MQEKKLAEILAGIGYGDPVVAYDKATRLLVAKVTIAGKRTTIRTHVSPKEKIMALLWLLLDKAYVALKELEKAERRQKRGRKEYLS